MRVKRELLYFFLFTLCVIVPFFNNYELTFLIWATTVILTVKKIYSKTFIILLSLFIVIFFLAMFMGVFYQHKLYFVIRDITYLLKPILGLLIGYQMFKSNSTKPLNYILYAGVIIAVYHLLLVIYAFLIVRVSNMHVLRFIAGYFNDYEVYVLVLLLFYKKFNIEISKKRRITFLLILGASSFFYLARTNFIQFLILVLALKGYFVINKRNIMILSSIVLLIGISYTAVYYYNPSRYGKGVEAFLYKVKNSPLEAFKTKINREDWKDFNDNYRAYENIRLFQQMSSRKTFLFGEGVGSQVNLKQKVLLGDMYLKYISILHNGFSTVLLKTGIIGLIIYLISILLMFKNPMYKDELVQSINYVFVGTGVFLFISNWVFMGFYNLVDTKTIIIGFLIAYREQLIKNLKST
ncbi:hypothetical protein SY27_11280 [Flavobacterium sp. 316]|uniref:O-antigen ligase family protein n=1 Tax=Flavobacterium sp. 316 TaxID=1603293 RepID=UPI0005E2F2A6|nr:O-antigen ligase family protein [Flavobacterium sp. 316]KIX20492.1 hypothetical protein SY27_11280 [Flavobacterium sp. 316]